MKYNSFSCDSNFPSFSIEINVYRSDYLYTILQTVNSMYTPILPSIYVKSVQKYDL
jgi:hypothetical protein